MEIKKGQIVYNEQSKEMTEEPVREISFEDLTSRPSFITRTATSIDLSGAASTLICLHTELEAELVRAFFLYTEASSADAGVAVKIGKESDDDYYYTGTSETDKAIWYTKNLTLLKKDITKGDTVILTNAGGKSGTGEIMLVIEYIVRGTYHGE